MTAPALSNTEKFAKSGSTGKAITFVFNDQGIDFSHSSLKDYSYHVLGHRIAKKVYAIQIIYVRRHPDSISLTENMIEIHKPVIYHAIVRPDNY